MTDLLYYGGIVAAVITLLAFVLQLKKMVITKDTTGISYHLSFWLSLSMLLWVGFGLSLDEPVIWVTNAIGVSLNGCMIFVKFIVEK